MSYISFFKKNISAGQVSLPQVDMSLKYKNEITNLYSCGCLNTYFETKRSGRNDEQNKINKVKNGSA